MEKKKDSLPGFDVAATTQEEQCLSLLRNVNRILLACFMLGETAEALYMMSLTLRRIKNNLHLLTLLQKDNLKLSEGNDE